jgi:TPR repeat protein
LNDKAKGRYWVLKAAEAGHVTAARVLGRGIYISEDSPYRDLQEALKWLVRAAEGGDAEAQFYLGSAYCPTIKNLYPVPQKDIWLAIQWFERAAAQGHIQAQEIGGFQTVGYAKDIRNKKESYAIGAHGIRLLEMGVEQGNAHCALLLGIAYGLGYGVKKDNKKCHYYYAIAARGGDQKAIEHCRKFNIPY